MRGNNEFNGATNIPLNKGSSDNTVNSDIKEGVANAGNASHSQSLFVAPLRMDGGGYGPISNSNFSSFDETAKPPSMSSVSSVDKLGANSDANKPADDPESIA